MNLIFSRDFGWILTGTGAVDTWMWDGMRWRRIEELRSDWEWVE